jgi:hypothetical protein
VQIWPVLDPYACGLIRSTVEPLLDQFKPPFIAKMGFQRLTLGDAPFQVFFWGGGGGGASGWSRKGNWGEGMGVAEIDGEIPGVPGRGKRREEGRGMRVGGWLGVAMAHVV